MKTKFSCWKAHCVSTYLFLQNFLHLSVHPDLFNTDLIRSLFFNTFVICGIILFPLRYSCTGLWPKFCLLVSSKHGSAANGKIVFKICSLHTRIFLNEINRFLLTASKFLMSCRNLLFGSQNEMVRF